MRRGIATIAGIQIALIALAAGSAHADPRAHPDAPRIAQAVIDFADALQSGDAVVLGRVIWTPEEPIGGISGGGDRPVMPATTQSSAGIRARDAFIRHVVARKALRDAAVGRWNQQGDRFFPQQPLVFPPQLRSTLARHVQIAQALHDAHVVLPNATRPIVLHADPAGNWRIVVGEVEDLAGAMVRGPEESDWPLTQIDRQTAAVDQTTRLVIDGTLASPAEAQRQLSDRLLAVAEEIRSERRRRWYGRPPLDATGDR